MGGTFVITLREGFEAALILGIVYTYLQKIGAQRHYRYATRGGVLGVLASIALGVVVTVLSGPLLDLGPDIIGLAVIFVAVVVLTWHGYWMRQHARAMKGDVQRKIDEAQTTHRMWIIGVIAFTGVFREGAETVLFLWGLLTQATSTSGWASALGAVLGLIMAASLGWAIFRGGPRLPRWIPERADRLPLATVGTRGRQLCPLSGRGGVSPVPLGLVEPSCGRAEGTYPGSRRLRGRVPRTRL